MAHCTARKGGHKTPTTWMPWRKRYTVEKVCPFQLDDNATEVECTEIFGTGQRIQGVIYARDRIAVLAGDRIEPAIVYAKAG